jgi:hypothetical protein
LIRNGIYGVPTPFWGASAVVALPDAPRNFAQNALTWPTGRFVSLPPGRYETAFILPEKAGGLGCRMTGSGTVAAAISATGNIASNLTGSGALAASGSRGVNLDADLSGSCATSFTPQAKGHLTCDVSIGARPSAYDISQAVWTQTQAGLDIEGTMGYANIHGGATGGGDWTETEKNQIRYRLGVDGTSSSPTASPTLALEATSQAILAEVGERVQSNLPTVVFRPNTGEATRWVYIEAFIYNSSGDLFDPPSQGLGFIISDATNAMITCYKTAGGVALDQANVCYHSSKTNKPQKLVKVTTGVYECYIPITDTTELGTVTVKWSWFDTYPTVHKKVIRSFSIELANADPLTLDDIEGSTVLAMKADTDTIAGLINALNDPSVSDIVTGVFAHAVETGLTADQALKLITAALAGKLSGAAGPTVTIRDVNDTKDRITATVDSNGNRMAVTLDKT